MSSCIWKKNKPYYHYDNYKSFDEAIKVAKERKIEMIKEGIKIKHWIQIYENILGQKRYALYLTRISKLIW